MTLLVLALLTLLAAPAQAQRQPFVTLVQPPGPLPDIPRPTAPYAALPRILEVQYTLLVSTAENRKVNDALLRHAETVPAGNTVAVKVLWEGLHFRGITDNPDGFLMKPGQRQDSRLIHGTNVQKARELGYDCTDAPVTLCFPSAGSQVRDPAGITPYIHEAMHAGTVEGWQEVAHRVRNDVGDQIDDLELHDTARPTRAAAQEIRAANLRGYRQAVYLATTFTGFSAPELSRHIYATGTATLDVYEALATFRDLPPGASQNLAAVALTGDLVNAGLLLADALGAGPPSADAIIIAEIGKLQEHVQELRIEMHERFDGVHEHLDAVYAAMVDGFAVLARGNRLAFESVLANLDDRRRQLTELGRVQLDTQEIVVQQSEFLASLLIDIELANCLSPPSSVRSMDQGKFELCRNKIAALHGTLPARQLQEPQAVSTIDYWLEARPDQTISWEFQNFRRLLSATGPDGNTRALSLPTSVVGPESWFAIMDLHDGFLVTYPDLAAQDVQATGQSAFASSMRLWRSDLARYAESIREELRAFQESARPTAFSILLGEAWSAERFADLLRSVGDPVELLWGCIDVPADSRAACQELGALGSSAHVRERLLGMTEFTEMEQAMSLAGSQLQHWIALAFRNRIGRSDVVTSLGSGWHSLPHLRDIVNSADLAFASWPSVIAQIEHDMESVEEMLRSEAMKSEVALPLDNDILTGFRFPGLGDVSLGEVELQ